MKLTETKGTISFVLLVSIAMTAVMNFGKFCCSKIPFYYRKRYFCYLNLGKNNTIDFAFVRVNELTKIIQEAILLNETVHYT